MLSTSEVGTSEAEIKVLLELQKRGLNKWLKYQYPIPLNLKFGVMFTVADFYYSTLKLAIFLDGEPHEKKSRFLKDENIDEALKEKGIRVLRFSYTSPITKERVKEIVDEIEKEVNRSGLFDFIR